MKQDSEIEPRRTKVNECLNKQFSDLCELCLYLKVFAACVNLPIYETSRIRIFLPPRREERQVRIKYYFSFFAAFAGNIRFFWLLRSGAVHLR